MMPCGSADSFTHPIDPIVKPAPLEVRKRTSTLLDTARELSLRIAEAKGCHCIVAGSN